MSQLPRYDITQSYQWNYDHSPGPVERDVPSMPGNWSFCGLPVPSPLGIAAGPLLNGDWCLYYASLGFDILTYKTVRSSGRICYDPPNLQPVKTGPLFGGEKNIPIAGELTDSWAVSFGMPSREPGDWQKDVERTRTLLPKEKLLVVSVVASEQPGWTIDDLAADYALTAKMAAEHGADIVEMNFSCPNVSSCDGQLYMNAADSTLVTQQARDAIGPNLPLAIKIGHLTDQVTAEQLIDGVSPFATALVTTNGIAATVVDQNNRPLYDGRPRGICGAAIRDASIQQVQMMRDIIEKQQSNLKLIGVSGISTAADVDRYLEAGAEAVELATAVMLDPEVALKIRAEKNGSAQDFEPTRE
ncbi:MAG: hypothetical protein COA78_01515 [Blastopirellula sp.]|nr:MAG: hypothetical protein COA78_01515 [Blastopirellula sp.]